MKLKKLLRGEKFYFLMCAFACIILGIQKSVGWAGDIHTQKPAFAIGVFVYFFRIVKHAFVDSNDFAIAGHINIACGFDGLHGSHFLPFGKSAADLRKVDKGNVAKRILRKIRNADNALASFNL